MTMTDTPAHVPHRIAEEVSKESGFEVDADDVQAVIDGEIFSERSFRLPVDVFRMIRNLAQEYGLEVRTR